MAPFDQHPPHVRRKIALVCTVGAAAILVLIMILTYAHGGQRKGQKALDLSGFYTTLTESAQSYLGGK